MCKHLYVLETVGQVCGFPLVNLVKGAEKHGQVCGFPLFKGAEKQCLRSISSTQALTSPYNLRR